MNKHLRQIIRATLGPSYIQSGGIIVLSVIMFLIFWIISPFGSYKEEIRLANAKAAENYESILWIATENCSLEVVRFLVENLIDINGTRNFGIMLLRHAVKKECMEIVRFLVEKKVDINSTSGSLSNRTALHYAAKQGNLEIVKFLLQKGANPSAKEFKGRKPRDLAIGQVTVMSLNNESSNKPYKEIIDLLDKAEKSYKSEK